MKRVTKQQKGVTHRGHSTVTVPSRLDHTVIRPLTTIYHMSEPRFPADLEREIFETAALTEVREIPTLLPVASQLVIWLKLYYWTYATLLGPWWHTAWTCSAAELKQLLGLCRRVVDIPCGNLTDPSLLPILAEMRLQRLFLSLENFLGYLPHLMHPLLTPKFRLCLRLPTWLYRLMCQGPRDAALTLLEQCPRLKLLLLLWPKFASILTSRHYFPVYDARFVIGVLDD
ncbi:hypothetical protein B0H12DRAFT_1074371 [Mycena haematopus]|nr:hypothetical protein B0H12DRAFT_1074371 [Mycena haematopus]